MSVSTDQVVNTEEVQVADTADGNGKEEVNSSLSNEVIISLRSKSTVHGNFCDQESNFPGESRSSGELSHTGHQCGDHAALSPWICVSPVHRLVWAFSIPLQAIHMHVRDLLIETLAISLMFGLLAGPIVYSYGIIHPEKASFSPLLLLKAFFIPCVLEETIFRVLMNPHPNERAGWLSTLFWGVASVILYVGWHPLNGWLLTPAVRPIFYRLSFLTTTTILGTMCLAAYVRTGSIWPPVLIHWATVCIWLSLGGKEELNPGVQAI